MKKCIIALVLGNTILFSISSQENISETFLFLSDLYSKNTTNICDIDFINLSPWVLAKPDILTIPRSNVFDIKAEPGTKKSITRVDNKTQDYSGLAWIFGIIVYNAIPNNLKNMPRQQQQEMINKSLGRESNVLRFW
jgi:hypothetical protein